MDMTVEGLDLFLANWLRRRGDQVGVETALREAKEVLDQLRKEHGHNPNAPAYYRHRNLLSRPR